MSMEIIILGCALAVIALVLAGTLWSRVPPMPTSGPVRREMLALTGELEPAKIYELGAGWGGLATAFARAHPTARVVAVELSPLPWLAARLRRALSGPANLEVRWGDALKTDLSDADLVVCFLFPEVMTPLADKLARELRPGAHVVSNAFALPGWRPVAERRVADLHRSLVYLYAR